MGSLIIVGAGAAGTHVLAALAQRRTLRLRRVAVVEAGDDLGPGLAYGDAADPRHTYGRVPTKRRDKGNLLRALLARSVKALRDRGIAVDVYERFPAIALARDGDGWRVETRRAAIAADACVLATGHWHVHALAHLQRAVDWRWDARRLAAIGDREDTLVLGASQSAIDLAIALAHRSSYAGTITLASRTGRFPRVWGYLGASKLAPGAAHRLDELRGRPGVRLADILAAVRADLVAAGGSWDDLLPASSGVTALREDLADALRSKEARREIPWQSVLWPTVPAVFDLFPRLPAEDRLAIAPYHHAALRHLEAIHTGNAQRIVALADAGRLRCVALGDPIAVAEDAHGVVASGPHGEARGHRVVDARGHDPHVAHSDDAFLRAALSAGHVAPARVPYAGRAGWLETGGIAVDPTTFATLDATGARVPNLYALGPLAMGLYPVYLGLWALRREAASIVRDL